MKPPDIIVLTPNGRFLKISLDCFESQAFTARIHFLREETLNVGFWILKIDGCASEKMRITEKQVMRQADIYVPPMRTSRHLVTCGHTRGWALTMGAAVMAFGAVEAIIKELLNLLVPSPDGTDVPASDLMRAVDCGEKRKHAGCLQDSCDERRRLEGAF